jgi:GNAT superfamily N-acetyltransferase
MLKLEIRDYCQDDYEKYIKNLTKKNMKKYFMDNFGGWSDEVSRDRFFKVVVNGYVKLFFIKDKFVGYVSFNLEKNDSSSYLINDIHIVEEFQGQGYGTEILNYVKLTCKGAKQLKVFVFKENPALNFYLKNGFKEIRSLEKSNSCVLVLSLV